MTTSINKISEPWHLRYCTGDQLPPAVLAYEAATNPTPQPPTEEDDMAQLIKVDDGDTAIFLSAAGIARHVDRDALNKLQYVGQAPKTVPTMVPRGFLDSLLIAGSLPADTITKRSDFGGEA